MEFQKSIVELIKLRTSTRSYDERELNASALQKLTDYITEINEGKKIKGNFLLAINNISVDGKAKKLGTYGVISGARSFIIGTIDKEEKDVLTFGYLFEKIVLFATDLGIQTCWLGGTFKKSDFERNTLLTDNEFIPIVSPIGYKKNKPRTFETAMRAVIGANKRKPWSELFLEADNAPLKEEGAGLYAVSLEMVRLAPSASNKQPWRIIHSENAFHFFLCRTKGYGVANFDIQLNDIGIAKCHFELAANEMGLKGSWQKVKKVEVPTEWEYIITWVMEA